MCFTIILDDLPISHHKAIAIAILPICYLDCLLSSEKVLLAALVLPNIKLKVFAITVEGGPRK
jgi:hypothetical protein